MVHDVGIESKPDLPNIGLLVLVFWHSDRIKVISYQTEKVKDLSEWPVPEVLSLVSILHVSVADVGVFT